MKILVIPIKRVWYDLIKMGIKNEEYRKVKPFWISRLGTEKNFKKYDAVRFVNGYSKTSPNFLIEFKGIRIAFGKWEWGASKTEKHFVISLGKVI